VTSEVPDHFQKGAWFGCILGGHSHLFEVTWAPEMSVEALKVNINNLSGTQVASMEMNKTTTVLELKRKIEEKCQWPVAQQKLLLDTTIDLCPGSKTLGDFAGDCKELEVLLVKLFADEVYFLGLSCNWLRCGISDKNCNALGDQLTNGDDGSRFKKIAKGADTWAFESVAHPGWFMCVNDVHGLVLGLPDENTELFREASAWSVDSAKVSLESVACPGKWMAHSDGNMHVRGAGGQFFNNDASWQIVEASAE